MWNSSIGHSTIIALFQTLHVDLQNKTMPTIQPTLPALSSQKENGDTRLTSKHEMSGQPLEIATPTRVIDVQSGSNHLIVLTDDCEVMSMGLWGVIIVIIFHIFIIIVIFFCVRHIVIITLLRSQICG